MEEREIGSGRLIKKLEGVFEIRKIAVKGPSFPGHYVCPDGEHELINSLTVGKGTGEIDGAYIDRLIYQKAKEMGLVQSNGLVPYNLTITITINPNSSSSQ